MAHNSSYSLSNQKRPKKNKVNDSASSNDRLSRDSILKKFNELKRKSNTKPKKSYRGKPFPMATAAFQTKKLKKVEVTQLQSLLSNDGINFKESSSKYENYLDE